MSQTFVDLLYDLTNCRRSEICEVEKSISTLRDSLSEVNARELIALAPRSEAWRFGYLRGESLRYWYLMKNVLGLTSSQVFLATVVQESGYDRRYLVGGIIAARNRFTGKYAVSNEVAKAFVNFSSELLLDLQSRKFFDGSEAVTLVRILGLFGSDENILPLTTFEKFTQETGNDYPSVKDSLGRAMNALKTRNPL